MIRFELSIDTPLKIGNFNNYFSKSLKLYNHKYIEFEVLKIPGLLFNIYIDSSYTGQDHAGPELTFGLFQHVIRIKIYDHRHWDYNLDYWESN